MGKIVAIGGGETFAENELIDREIVRLSGKKNPTLLFIPTAKDDQENEYGKVIEHFGKKLGCKTDVLYLVKEEPSREEIGSKILGSDIIYVGGGNTLKMMKVWREKGVDKLLKKAYNKGIVLSGLSAGSICWFEYGESDSLKSSNLNAEFIRVRGLGLIPASECPHFDSEAERRPSLKKMMKRTPGVDIALDDDCAIEILDDKYRILASRDNANAFRVYWKEKEFYEEKIEKSDTFRPLKNLLSK